MYEDMRTALQDAAAAAAPHLIAAGRELIAAGTAFVEALNGEGGSAEMVEVDIAVE